MDNICKFVIYKVFKGAVYHQDDRSATELYRHIAVKSCASIVFSSPDLTIGETYTVTAGENATDVTLNGVSTGGQSMWQRW